MKMQGFWVFDTTIHFSCETGTRERERDFGPWLKSCQQQQILLFVGRIPSELTIIW